MDPNLQVLIDLQEVDNTIRGLESEIQALPARIAEIESSLSSHIQKVESDKARIAENQRGRRQRENEITALRDKISKLKDQMLEVKTNEQYRAFMHEIEFHEAGIRKLEDEILAEMIESEALERQLRQAEQALASERARARQEIDVADRRKQQDEEKLKAIRARREEARSRLDSDTYFTYERIAHARRGLAVAAVLDEACSSCHVRLRPQAYNDVRKNENIFKCESCGCILYYVPPPPSE